MFLLFLFIFILVSRFNFSKSIMDASTKQVKPLKVKVHKKKVTVAIGMVAYFANFANFGNFAYFELFELC